MWILDLLGRLHPLLVHFPIGLLVVAALLEIIHLQQKNDSLKAGIRAMVYIGAISALFAMIAGLLLVNSGEYGGESILRHRNGGIVTSVLSLVTAALLWKNAISYYRIGLFVTVLSLSISGHWGALLTHGSDYLTAALPSNKPEGNQSELLDKISASDTVNTEILDQLNLQVRTIFAHKCYKCHSEEKTKGGLILENEAAVMAGGESGPILIPGNAKKSELVRRLNLPDEHEDVMPNKGKKLKAREIALISKWVDLGAHWTDAEVKTFREAPLALSMPVLPPATAEFQRPLDRLLHAYFNKKGIRQQAAVDDRTFIRRVYLDLIGLVPEARDIQAFSADNSPNKRADLVQSLLNRRHDYAQHWLSFWNDLLRNDYSGTGFITGGRTQITDWLYQSLLDHKPYDQMLRELIDPGEESLGFIKGIRWRGVVNASQRTEMQAAQNIAQAFMGLNLKCASCHDSFVSNLSLEQAYGFASIFADSALEIHRCDKPTGEMAQTAFLFPDLGEVNADSVKDRLKQLSQVIVQPANGRLYRTIVNRLWARLLGRGIIYPVDEMDNIPWSQEMLDYLAADLVANNYDLTHTLKQIVLSRAYQLPSIPYKKIADVRDQAYVFKGPLRRRLSAEQFADAMSQFLSPIYYAVAYDPTNEPLKAQWIWTRERSLERDILPKAGKRYFRHTFELKDIRGILKAQALLSVDHAFQFFLNGTLIGSGTDWRKVNRYQLSDHLQAGKNIIAIEGTNEGSIPNPAGVLFSLRILLADSTEIEIASDTHWKTSRETTGDNWAQLDYDDSQWEASRRQRRSHWGKLLDFSTQSKTAIVPFARASLSYLDPFQKALGRPSRENIATARDDRATLLQALELTNGTFFNEALSRGAHNWLEHYPTDASQLITDLYLKAFGRKPGREEQRLAQALLGQQPSPEALQDLLWSMVLLPEFQLVY